MMQEFVDQVNKTARKATEDMHTALPGVITSFDPGSGMASVQPKAKFKKPDGKNDGLPGSDGGAGGLPSKCWGNDCLAY